MITNMGLTKKISFLLTFFVLTFSFAQKNIYENRRFDELAENHEVLAIIPFITNLDLEQEIGTNELKQLEQKEGYAVQNALETYFSQRKKRKKFNVDFQNVEDTNAILNQNSISYDNLDIFTTSQLCEILKVDGIISGTLSLNILLSEGVPTDFNILDFFIGDADYGRIGVKVSDGGTGKLLWKYEKAITKKTGKNTVELIDKMMKLASRKFPYDKEKNRKAKND